jgi:hypothetical protein
MAAYKYNLENMWPLLRRAASDPGVIQFTGCEPEAIERVSYQGFVNLKPVGISVMFKEAPWVVPMSPGEGASTLHVARTTCRTGENHGSA